MMNKSAARYLLLAMLFVCSITVSALEQVKTDEVSTSFVEPTLVNDSINPSGTVKISPSEAIQTLLQYATSFNGAIYRRGGEHPETGFDCSGFVCYVFYRVGEVQLPHSANAIGRLGNAVQRSEFIPGDLVFFRRGKRKVSHVGIYLGENQFIHAASRRTGRVMVSSLADRYWAKHFIFGRRITLENQSSQKFENESLLEPNSSTINSADK